MKEYAFENRTLGVGYITTLKDGLRAINIAKQNGHDAILWTIDNGIVCLTNDKGVVFSTEGMEILINNQ